MNIFHDLDPASYNQVMHLFDVWLKKYGIDLSDRKVRSEVEDLMGEVLESTSFSENIRQEITDRTRDELRDEVWEDVKAGLRSEIRDEIELELRKEIEAEYEEKQNAEDDDD